MIASDTNAAREQFEQSWHLQRKVSGIRELMGLP